MSRDDWFQSKTWNAEIAAEFEKRLSRVKTPYYRAYRLRIQGRALAESGDAAMQAKGVELLQRVISEYPDHEIEAASAHHNLGDHFRRIGDCAQAESEYRQVVDFYKAQSSRKTNVFLGGFADLSLVEVILDTNASEKYAEARSLLEDLLRDTHRPLGFNSDILRYHAAWARLLARMDGHQPAAEHAKQALQIAATVDPQLTRHPKMGIPDASPELLEELRSIGGKKSRPSFVQRVKDHIKGK